MIRPTDLTVLAKQSIAGHSGGLVKLKASPEYREDIAIRVGSR